MILCVCFFSIFGCKGSGFSEPSSLERKTALISFNANKETAVKTKGGYKVFIGSTPGFAPESAVKVVEVPGNIESSGKVQALISGITAGKYYTKIQAYSSLVDPNKGTSAVSELSDEVVFDVQ